MRKLFIVLLLASVPAWALNPQLGKISITARDNSGNAVASATVRICHQGATVNGAQSGTDPLTVTVEDIGGIGTTPTVSIGTGSTTYTATIASETTITISGFAGTLSLSDDDRIRSCISAPPTLYADAQGTETQTNPLTSSSTGLAEAWVRGGFYDILVSKTGITTTLIQDYFVEASDVRLNTYPNDSAVTMYRLDAARSTTWAAADTLFAVGRAGTNEFYVDGVGGTHATGASDVSTGGFTVTAGGLTVSSGTTAVQALTATTFTASSTVSVPAGEIGTSEIAANAITTAAVNTTDTTDNTFTTEEVLVTSASYTITASNTMTLVVFNASITINGGTSVVVLRLRRGGLAGTLLYTWKYELNNAGAGDHTMPISLWYPLIGEPSGAQTYSITGEETGAGSAQVYGSTVAATTITVFELKK